MTENEFMLQFITGQLTQLRDDFRADLTLMEGRLTERIGEVNSVVRVNSGRINTLETTSAYRKGAVWAISAIVSGTIAAAGLALRMWGR